MAGGIPSTAVVAGDITLPVVVVVGATVLVDDVPVGIVDASVAGPEATPRRVYGRDRTVEERFEPPRFPRGMTKTLRADCRSEHERE